NSRSAARETSQCWLNQTLETVLFRFPDQKVGSPQGDQANQWGHHIGIDDAAAIRRRRCRHQLSRIVPIAVDRHTAKVPTYELSDVYTIQMLEIFADLISMVEDDDRHAARGD